MSNGRTGDLARHAPKWAGVVSVVAAVIGGAYLGLYRLDQVEARVDKLETKVEVKASTQDVDSIRRILGNVQLDVALLCAEAVRARGGDPLRECRTSRGSP